MPPPSKRPGPPVPDPNWERDFHPAPAGGSQAPASRDPLLAHAVTHHAEPDPLDLDLFDELSELDRTTVPPPEAMHDHVARMMAEASLFEAIDDTGDRPTPLIEVPDGITRHGEGSVDSVPAVLRGSIPASSASSARDPKPSAAAITARETRSSTTAARDAKPSLAAARAHGGGAPIAAVQVKQVTRSAVPAGSHEARSPSVTMAAQGGTAPPRNGKGSGQYSAISPRTAPKPRSEVPPKPAEPRFDDSAGRAPSFSMGSQAAPTPGAQRGPAPKPSEPRLDSLDFSDLPPVFALDAWEVDDPALSEPAISPAMISPPFDSTDLRRIGAPDPIAERAAAIEARITAGEYGPALMLAEAALEEHPGASAIVSQAESCREVLYKRYLERLGASDHVPRIVVQHSAITALSLDHRAGFLLSCVDGGSTIEEIIDVSAMPRLDAVRILYELVQEGVIEMASR